MKKRYLLLIGFLGLFVFVICMSSVSAWYDTDWAYRKSITIDHDKVDCHLDNFPVLFNITDSNLSSKAQSDFDDILFTDSNGNKLSYEIEEYDSSTGDLIVWVNSSSLSSSVDTVLYMYYGNSGCGSQEDPSGVWNSSFVGVYHFNDASGAGYSNLGLDSTSNSNDGSVDASVSPVEGAIDGAVDFDRVNEERIRLFSEYGGNNEYSIEMWFKTSADVSNEQFLYAYDDATYNVYTFLTIDSSILYGFTYDGAANYVWDMAIAPNTEYHVVLTALESDNLRLYVNGSFVMQEGIGNFDEFITDEHSIGDRNYRANQDGFDGWIDEVRISEVNNSVGFVSTSYNTQFYDNSGEGFFTLGSEEGSYVNINASSDVVVTGMTLNGYIMAGQNFSCGFWVGTNSSVNHTYNVQNISVSGIYDVGESFSSGVTGLSASTVYYIKAWAKNESGFYNSSFITTLTKAEAPTGIDTVVVNKSAINISWTKGSGANNTIVVSKSGSYPSSISDGSVIGNTTGSYLVVDGLSGGDTFYYSLWSYNNRTLANGSFLSQVSDNKTNVVYAFLVVSVYDEATGNALSDWNITVSNIDGSSVYNSSGNSNPLGINTSLLPIGSVSVIVSCNNYEQRVYNLNIQSNSFYVLNVYLPKKNVSQLCRIDVVGPQTEYGANPPIEDAFVRVKEFDNESGIYQNVSTFYTDANGQFFVHLDINTQYIVVVNKSGYNTETSSFIVQNGVQIYTFRISESSGVAQSWNIFHDVVSLSVTKYSNGSMYISYVDGGGTTVDTDVFVYEIWNGSLFLNHSDSRSSNSFGFWVSGLNVFRSHRVLLFFNNSLSFDVDSPYSVIVFPFYSAETHSFSFNDRMTNLIGPFMINDIVLGWHSLISIIVGLLILAMFGPRNTGMGIIGCGLGIALMEVLFTTWFTDIFPALLITLAPLCIVIGIVYLKSQPDGGAML